MGYVEDLQGQINDIQADMNELQTRLVTVQSQLNILLEAEGKKQQEQSAPQAVFARQTYVPQGYVSMQERAGSQPTQQLLSQQQVILQPVTPHPAIQPQPVVQPQAQPVIQPQPVVQPQVQPMPQPQVMPQPQPRKELTESFIGSHIMGILASVLVLIAVVLFAKVLIPYIDDTAKMVLMYSASIALTAFGYYKHKKKPENTFFTSLFGCGAGALYLSIVLTRGYFKAIDDIIMYVLLLTWGLLLLVAIKDSQKMVQIIGNLGYFIAVFFSAGLKDRAFIIPMLGYVLVLGIVYQIVFWNNKVQRYIQYTINMVVLFMYEVLVLSNFDNDIYAAVVCFAAMLAGTVSFVIYTYKNFKLPRYANSVPACINTLYFAFSYIFFAMIIDTDEVVNVIVCLGIAFVCEAAYMLLVKKYQEKTLPCFDALWTGFWLLIAVGYVYTEYDEFVAMVVMVAMIILVMVIGFIMDHMPIKVQGWSLLFVGTALFAAVNGYEYFLLGALFISASAFVIESIGINKYSSFKLVSYLATQFFIITTIYELRHVLFGTGSSDIRRFVVVLITGIFNAALLKLHFAKTRDGKEAAYIVKVLNVINVLVMLCGLALMSDAGSTVIKALYVVITTLFASVNLDRHLRNPKKEMLYAGIKYGIILLATLEAFDAPSYALSLGILLFGILCIIIGFYKKISSKQLRIYGLVLAMICVAKFIMIDITYENTVGHAMSFLVSGLLCFGISAIYSHFEKQSAKEGTGT